MKLRNRLLIAAAMLAVTYGVMALVVVSTQRSLLISQLDKQLRGLPPVAQPGRSLPPPADANAPLSGSEGGPAQSEGESEQNTTFSEIYIGMVTDDMTRPIFTGALLTDTPRISDAVAKSDGKDETVTIGAIGSQVRFRALVMPQPDGRSWLVAALPLDQTDAALARLTQTLWIGGAALLLVLGVAGFWVQRLGLRPIGRVTATAEAITAGDRTQRVAGGDTRTEAGRLAHAFNVMLDQRDIAEARLRQFVADASHELRTPLTAIRGYLALYQQGAFREPNQLDDAVRRLAAESARMHGLVEDLLALASLDEGRPLDREEVDLGQILRDAAQDAQAIQPTRAISTVVPARGPEIIGDRSLLIQLAGILVSNALTHTPVSASVTLTATIEQPWAILTVTDTGPGLDSAEAAHVFDRFWRRETSRTRNHTNATRGGSGLGLSIARSIAEAHGGTISVQSTRGTGSIFTVRLLQTTDRQHASQNAPADVKTQGPSSPP